MTAYLLLLKMLHCKMHKRKSICKRKNNERNNSVLTPEINVKQEIAYQETSLQCRVCLKHGDIPIFGVDSEDDMSEAFCAIGGIEINQDDTYPQFMCEPCNSLLQSAILFRKTVQKSNDILLKKFNDTKSDTDENVCTDDSVYFEYEDEKDSNQKTVYNCKKCDLNFKSYKEYHDHRLSLEHENFRRTCPVCKNSYTSLYFKKHLALHRLETKYMCDICGKKFIVQGQFSKHRLTHFNNFPFKCSLCPYKGRFNESLKMHMRTHTGEKPYQCSLCPSRFVNKSNLNKHILTHKDHDYKCESCGRGFYTKRQMDLHLKVDHTGIKDHVCNICGKAFGYRKQMMKHQLKVHKRQKFQSGRMPLYMQVETVNK